MLPPLEELREAIILRLISLDRAVHSVLFGLLALVVFAAELNLKKRLFAIGGGAKTLRREELTGPRCSGHRSRPPARASMAPGREGGEPP